MADDDYFYEPRRGHGLSHDPMNAIVAPRPIGWISSRDGDGVLNLAPYSFFNLFSYRPPIVGFSSNGRKDSVRNATALGEFVWNLVTRDLAARMNVTSAVVPAGVDEFALAGLTPAPSAIVSVPRVAESPVSFECRVAQNRATAGRRRHEGGFLAGAGRSRRRPHRARPARRRPLRHGGRPSRRPRRRPGRLLRDHGGDALPDNPSLVSAPRRTCRTCPDGVPSRVLVAPGPEGPGLRTSARPLCPPAPDVPGAPDLKVCGPAPPPGLSELQPRRIPGTPDPQEFPEPRTFRSGGPISSAPGTRAPMAIDSWRSRPRRASTNLRPAFLSRRLQLPTLGDRAGQPAPVSRCEHT